MTDSRNARDVWLARPSAWPKRMEAGRSGNRRITLFPPQRTDRPMQPELSTAGPPPDEQDRPSDLMSLHHTSAASGLGVSWTPDECDLLGACTYPHNRMTQLVAELFRRSGELAASAKRMNDSQQAMLGDVDALQRQVGILFSENTALRQSIQALQQEPLRKVG